MKETLELNNNELYNLKHEDQHWDSDTEEVLYKKIHEKVTYTDLEKGYQQFEMKVKRVSDGKVFLFTGLYDSPYVDVVGHNKTATGTEVNTPRVTPPKKRIEALERMKKKIDEQIAFLKSQI